MRLAESRVRGGLARLRPRLASCEYRRLGAQRDRVRALQRAHAYVLVRELLQCAPEQAPIAYDADGRPRVVGWNVDVSFSHKGDRVLVGLVEAPLRAGVDLEDLTQQIDPERLGRHLLTAADRRTRDALAARGWSRQDATLALWSVKEAVCKASGFAFRPRSVGVRHIDARGEVTLDPSCEVVRSLDRSRWVAPPFIERRDHWVRAHWMLRA